MTLILDDVSITYRTGPKAVSALRNVSLHVEPGQTLGVVGESGSGKSSLGLALIRLLPSSARVTGRILLGDDDLVKKSEAEMRPIRGRRIGMIFQDSLASMNPVFTIESQLVDTLRCHRPELTRRAAADRAGEMLEEMGIKAGRMRDFPHQFSGGMRQRVMIAAALASDPDFLIADESTSDLDVISQKQILELLKRIQQRRQVGLIVISHDLGVINHVCESVAVLYRGDMVEAGDTVSVLARPQHWYTRGLIAVSRKEMGEDGQLRTLPSRAAAHRAATVA